MRVALLVMCLGSLLADDLEVHNGVDTVPTSNWAEVYLSDSTDYREPVREESPFPVVEAASRSDWFHSYPYQKFEERKEEEPGIFESLGNSMKDSVDTIGNTVKDSVDTIGNTVKDSVGTVRNNFVGVGEGVVNGALRLVGAETLREKQAKAKAREGYVYHGTHLRGPGYRPNGHSRDTTVLQAEESQASGPVRHSNSDTPIHERLRQSIRGVLDPIIYNPIKKLLKTDGKKSAQVQRRQHGKLPNPITGLKDFGSHVAGGFSKLTGLGRGATAKVRSSQRRPPKTSKRRWDLPRLPWQRRRPHRRQFGKRPPAPRRRPKPFKGRPKPPRRPNHPPPYPFTTFSPGSFPPFVEEIYTNTIPEEVYPEVSFTPSNDIDREVFTTRYYESPPTEAPPSKPGIQYFHTPSPNRVYDGDDQLVTVYDRYEVDQWQDKSDDKQTILKDFLSGQEQDQLKRPPSRRPNSYFYDAPVPEQKMDKIDPISEPTTSVPGISDSPLPTYETYTNGPTTPAFPELQILELTPEPTDFFETPSWNRNDEVELLESLGELKEDITMVMTTEGPKVFDVSPVTGSPIYRSSPRPSRTTPRNKFQNKPKDKTKKRSKQGGTGVANSYQQLGDQEEISVNLVYETTPGPEILPSSSIYQQIDGQVNVNISTPSDKAWLEVVTANPSLMRDPSPTPSPQSEISTTLKPSSTWKRQDSLDDQFEIEEVWREPQVTVTPRGAIPTMKGFMASPGQTKSPTIQPLVLGKRTSTTTLSPTTRYTSAPTRRTTVTSDFVSTPANSFSINTGIKWGPPGKKVNSRKDILSTLKANRKNWGKRRKSPKGKASQRGRPKDVNIDEALDKLVPETTISPRATSPSPAAWSATARPPPETITTPGWHIHSNANLPTQNTSPAPADSRLDSFSTNQPTDSTYVQISTQRPRPIKTRKKSKFHPKLKGRYKSKRKEDIYRRVHPHVQKFTSDDAISKSDVVQAKQSDTKLSGSRPRLSVAAVPTKGGRLLDAAPSLLLKHKVPQPRQKPLKKKGGWLLLGPRGASFHFDNLQQVLNLNQNNFVPG